VSWTSISVRVTFFGVKRRIRGSSLGSGTLIMALSDCSAAGTGQGGEEACLAAAGKSDNRCFHMSTLQKVSDRMVVPIFRLVTPMGAEKKGCTRGL
jgi:hypothetical protein